jgi:hypothetical protein
MTVSDVPPTLRHNSLRFPHFTLRRRNGPPSANVGVGCCVSPQPKSILPDLGPGRIFLCAAVLNLGNLRISHCGDARRRLLCRAYHSCGRPIYCQQRRGRPAVGRLRLRPPDFAARSGIRDAYRGQGCGALSRAGESSIEIAAISAWSLTGQPMKCSGKRACFAKTDIQRNRCDG